MGELQRHKRPGDVLGVVGCMAQRLGPALLERVPRVDLVVGPDAYRNLPELIGHAAAGASGRPTPSSDRGSTTRTCPRCGEAGPTAFVTVQRGLRLSLHLLHRSVHARPRAQPPAGRRRRRVPALAAEGTTRGHAARADGQQLSRWRPRFRRSAPGRGRGGRHPAAPVHQPVPHRLHARASSRPWPPPPAVCEHVHLPAQSGSNAVLRRMLRRYTRERYLEVVPPSSAGPFPASPSPPTSSSAFRERPRHSSRKRSRWWPTPISTTPTPSSTRCARERRRSGCRITCRTTSRRSGCERLIEAVRANARRKNVGRVGERARGARGASGPPGRAHARPHASEPSRASRPSAVGGRRVPHGATHRHDRFHLHRRHHRRHRKSPGSTRVGSLAVL